jgi:hypothetical protein
MDRIDAATVILLCASGIELALKQGRFDYVINYVRLLERVTRRLVGH